MTLLLHRPHMGRFFLFLVCRASQYYIAAVVVSDPITQIRHRKSQPPSSITSITQWFRAVRLPEPLQLQSFKRLYCFHGIFCTEDVTAGYKDIRSGRCEFGSCCSVHSPIDFYHCFGTGRIDKRPELLHFLD